MRASRLLSILTTLQAKGHVTAQALADECEVSVRTIYRDVDALRASGVPIYSVQGSSGGYRLLDGYRVRLNGVSSSEAQALFLAGLTQQAADLGMGSAAASARSKVLAALPEEMRSGAARSRFHFDAPAWFAEPETLAQLPTVAAAVWSERALRFRYASRAGTGERQVDPLGIVLKGGAWYLVAGVKSETKTFRIARMSNVHLLEKAFDYPKSFDLAGHWAESIRLYEVDLHPNKATIRLSPAGFAMLDDLLPPYIRSGAVISPENDRNGWRQVTISVGLLDHAAAEMLRFGTHAEVLEPPELRAKMTEIIASLAKMYRSSATPEG